LDLDNYCGLQYNPELAEKQSVNSKFEVYYFPIKGRAEPIRLILSFAKANWDNKKIEDWGKEKFSTKGLLFKQVPMLIETTTYGEENRLVETGSIIRYIARVFGLGNKEPFKNSLLDSYFEGLYEVFCKVISIPFITKEKEKVPELIKEDKLVKNFLDYHEDILKENGSNGYYMDNKLTYVDVVASCVIDNYMTFTGLSFSDVKEIYPNLAKVYENVNMNEDIIAYNNSSKCL
jgi:glutathione S-transferase